MTTGQWLTGGDGVRWFFEAGAECLDFAYTGDWGLGVPAWEQVHTPADLGRWLAERHERLDPRDATERDLVDARQLRAAIARLATAVADGLPRDPDDIDTLNLFAAMPDIPPALDGGRRQAGASRLRVSQALSTIARDGIRILAVDDDRIRRCSAGDCRMVFHDESRTRNRRWCSMQRCGNRAKVRAHRARRSIEERTPAT